MESLILELEDTFLKVVDIHFECKIQVRFSSHIDNESTSNTTIKLCNVLLKDESKVSSVRHNFLTRLEQFIPITPSAQLSSRITHYSLLLYLRCTYSIIKINEGRISPRSCIHYSSYCTTCDSIIFFFFLRSETVDLCSLSTQILLS